MCCVSESWPGPLGGQTPQAGRQALPPRRRTLSPTLPFGSTEVSPPVSSLEGDPRASSPEWSDIPRLSGGHQNSRLMVTRRTS